MDFGSVESFGEVFDRVMKYIRDITAQKDRLQQILIRNDIMHTSQIKDNPSNPEKMENNKIDHFLDILKQTITDSIANTRYLTDSNQKLTTAIKQNTCMCTRIIEHFLERNEIEIEELKQKNQELKKIARYQLESNTLSCELEDTKNKLKDVQSRFEKCESIFHDLMDVIEQLRKQRHIELESKDEPGRINQPIARSLKRSLESKDLFVAKSKSQKLEGENETNLDIPTSKSPNKTDVPVIVIKDNDSCNDDRHDDDKVKRVSKLHRK